MKMRRGPGLCGFVACMNSRTPGALRKISTPQTNAALHALPGDGAGALRWAPVWSQPGFSDEASRRLTQAIFIDNLELDGDGAS